MSSLSLEGSGPDIVLASKALGGPHTGELKDSEGLKKETVKARMFVENIFDTTPVNICSFHPDYKTHSLHALIYKIMHSYRLKFTDKISETNVYNIKPH